MVLEPKLYLLRRSLAHRAMAAVAVDERVRRVHLEFAERYIAKANDVTYQPRPEFSYIRSIIDPDRVIFGWDARCDVAAAGKYGIAAAVRRRDDHSN